MKQSSKPYKKAKNPQSNVRIHRLITEQEFLERVAKDPNSVFTDFDVKYAVETLGKWCRLGGEGLKSNCTRILKKAGLTAYIPKTSRGNLKVYRENPERLLSEVKLRVSRLQKVLPKRTKSDQEKLVAIRKLIGSLSTGKSIHSFFPTMILIDCTNIALGWIAYENMVSFYTVSNLYEKMKKTSSKVGTPPYLDDYKKAYSDYVIREHSQPSMQGYGLKTKHGYSKITRVDKAGNIIEIL